MCFLCAISLWSRRVAGMLPWLVVPFSIVWALSQLFLPNYCLEITSSRLACLGVLFLSLIWYEILMPWLSSRKAHKSVVLRERQLIEALETAKWRKEATRRCRNCLTAYNLQMPGSGKYVCRNCGHISKRPLLEVAGNLANSRLPTSGSGESNNGAGLPHMRGVCQRNGPLTAWYRAAGRNRCAWIGESPHVAENCSFKQYFLSLISKPWLFPWRKVLGIGKWTKDGRASVNGTSEFVYDASRSRIEKARRKAEKKKQARLQKDLLEAEDRKQREEVASLVEERRRERDKHEILQQKEKESSIEKQRETQKERDNGKLIDKSVRKFGRSEKTGPLDQVLEHELGPVQYTTKDAGDRLAGSSKEQIHGSIISLKHSRGLVQNHLCKHSTMHRTSKLGFWNKAGTSMHKSSLTALKMRVTPQCDKISGIKEESSYVGKSIMSGGPSNLSPGAAGDTHVPASVWKRAPWISASAKGSNEMDLNSVSARKEEHGGSNKSLEQGQITALDSSSNFVLIDKPLISPVRATPIQPPIAPPSSCADPLQQLFSTPSLFPPMDICAATNYSSEENSQNQAKHVFLPEHTFFEAPNFIQPTSDKDVSLPQTAISNSLSNFTETNVVPKCSLFSDGSFECKPRCIEVCQAEMPPCDTPSASDLSASICTAMSPSGSEKDVDLDTCTNNTLLWKNDEESFQLSSLGTVEALLDTDFYTSDTCLLSPQKPDIQKLKEDAIAEPGPGCTDQNCGFFALYTSEPIWEDVDGSQKLPAEFVDCITQEIMEEPVITADGHSYERMAIEKWLKHHDTSPKTGEVLPPPPGGIGVDKTLRPNHILRDQITEYKERLRRISASQWIKSTSGDAASVFNLTISPHVLSF